MNMKSKFDSKSKAVSILESLKQYDQDFEWYPTASEMVEVIGMDLDENYNFKSILDIGAGDGRVLKKIEDLVCGSDDTLDKYAIEISRPHLNSMDKNIFVIGTDFHEQNLIDKRVDIIFSNPPFKQYEDWAVKIIKEANSKVLYFILPERWIKSERIRHAIEYRGQYVRSEILGTYNFDFAARATNYHTKVDVVKIDLVSRYTFDPFDLWFDDNFELEINTQPKSEYEVRCDIADNIKHKTENGMVLSGDLVTSLVQIYNSNLKDLVSSYQSICTIDPQLLKEMDVNIDNMKHLMRLKLKSLKTAYWNEFISRLEVITSRLCADSRKRLLNKLNTHASVDFTRLNAYAITEWALKNADSYIDDQFISHCDRLFKSVNVINYKSNDRTFFKEDWRYIDKTKDHVLLDYRIVLNFYSAIYNGSYSSDNHHGLTTYCASFVDDMIVVAYNLGFDTRHKESHASFEWTSGKEKTFHYNDHMSGDDQVLMKIRAYKNGNLHIKFNQKFILKLNVEYGRLKGWIKSKEEAFDEMSHAFSKMENSFASPDILEEAINSSFNSTFKLGNNTDQILLC
jgi:predicted RNA methylase